MFKDGKSKRLSRFSRKSEKKRCSRTGTDAGASIGVKVLTD